MGFFSNMYVTNVSISPNVKYRNNSMANAFASCISFNGQVNIPHGVTTIYRTFAGCSSLNTTQNIPNSVTNMANAFQLCSKLNLKINIPNSITDMTNAFASCNNMYYSPNLPSTGTMDMTNAFAHCYKLNQQVNIPNGVTCIKSIFSNCYSLNTVVNIPSSVLDMSYAFNNCYYFNRNVTIPEGVVNLSYAFNNCNRFNQNISIPDSARDLTYMFSNCNNLQQSIAIVKNVYEPGNGTINAKGMFYNCKKLYSTTVSYSNGVKNTIYININIPTHRVTDTSYMFYNASLSGNNTFIEFDDGMHFAYDENNNAYLESYTECLTNLSHMFDSSSINYQNQYESLVKQLSLPSSAINTAYMFYNCRYLNAPVYISGYNLQDMSFMFYNCANYNVGATVYTLPNSVINMASAFQNCGKYHSPVDASFNFPESVVNLANCCYGVKNLYSMNMKIGNNAQNLYGMFKNVTNAYGSLYIWSNNVTNAASMFNYRNTLYFNMNIYIRAGGTTEATFRGNAAANSITGTKITWTNSTNYFYNTSYKIYVHTNLVDPE